MQVQKIQSTNNYQSQNFKARLVPDSNGYLRRIWKAAEKNENLSKRIDEFAKNYPNHELEIADFKKENNYFQYDIFNRTTGKTDNIIGYDINSPKTMEYLLYSIMSGHIFREDNETKLYQKLTGRGK